MKLTRNPTYPRSFTPTNTFADEAAWVWTVADIKTNPEHYLEAQGPQFLYDMLLDALDRLEFAEKGKAETQEAFQQYRNKVLSAIS